MARSARHRLPETSAEGERRAQGWRAYLAGLKHAGRNPSIELDLDEAMPYAAALGAVDALEERLKEASSRRQAVACLAPEATDGTPDGGFYPRWVAFHAALMTPPAYPTERRGRRSGRGFLAAWHHRSGPADGARKRRRGRRTTNPRFFR